MGYDSPTGRGRSFLDRVTAFPACLITLLGTIMIKRPRSFFDCFNSMSLNDKFLFAEGTDYRYITGFFRRYLKTSQLCIDIALVDLILFGNFSSR